MTIGKRAVECIQNRACDTETTIQHQCDVLGFDRSRLVAWRKGKVNPDSWVLAQMHRQGYDVIYILTGKKAEAKPEDAVRVVRCKDCRFLIDREDGTHGCYRHFVEQCELDDFCSYGERKDND